MTTGVLFGPCVTILASAMRGLLEVRIAYLGVTPGTSVLAVPTQRVRCHLTTSLHQRLYPDLLSIVLGL